MMIKWIEYNKDKPPTFEETFLVKHYGGVTSGFCDKSDNGRITWHSYNGNSLIDPTHYAEMNLPDDKPDPDEGWIYCPNCGRVREDN